MVLLNSCCLFKLFIEYDFLSLSLIYSMLLNLQIFLLSILSIDVVFSENKVDNSTVVSRREILEQQARTAYQNACYRLQELSNWMTAVFRIKSVWASATVNELSSRSEGSLTEAGILQKYFTF